MLLLFGSLIIFFLMNIPLSFAVGLSCICWLLFSGVDIPLVVLPHRFLRGLDSFPLLAIPFFMLAGQFMSRGGCAHRLIAFAESVVGFMKGGMAHINIMASMFFSGMTGSAVSDTTAIGSILIPAMIKTGYKKDFSVAVTTISSVIGVIIPPSIVVVIYAIVAEVSIGDLLVAGIIPGILLGISQMITVAIYAHVKGYESVTTFSFRKIFTSFQKAFLSLITVIIVVGGIYAGIFTATEASIIAAVYSFLLATFIYRELSWKDIYHIFVNTAMICSLGLFLYGTTNIFGWIIATQQIPQQIFDFVIAITTNKILILFIIMAILIAIGTVLESVAAILILVPILAPIGIRIGMDPIHFGMVVVLAVAIGLATPPVGVCIFVACGLADVQVSKVVSALIPFVLAAIAVLILVAFVPDLSLMIPRMMR